MKGLLARIKLLDPLTLSIMLKVSILALAFAKILPTAGDPINADSI